MSYKIGQVLLLGPDYRSSSSSGRRVVNAFNAHNNPTQEDSSLSTSSAESLTLREALGGGIQEGTNVTLVVVEKEAMSLPSSFKMKVVGTAVWLVRSSTCSVHLITMAI